MSIKLDALRIKTKMDLPDRIKEFMETKNPLNNGTYYVTKIQDTIAYDAIQKNDYELYNEYIKYTNQREHTESVFLNLCENWDIEKCSKPNPIEANAYGHSTFFWVLDGCHRLVNFKKKQLYGDAIPTDKIKINFYKCAIDKIKEILKKTVDITHYNKWANRGDFGYHSFDIYNISIQGQRNPIRRFEKIKRYYEFSGKTVLDLGCNTGGMIFHLPELKKAIGVDFDKNCIDACHYLKKRFNFACEYEFVQADLNNFPIVHYTADIVFLLSVGSWVKNWEKLYTDAYSINNCVLLETNNDIEGKPQLELFYKLGATVQLVSDCSDDDITGNNGRKTYLCY